MKFNECLKKVRVSRSKTQKQMAELLSMTTNAYQRYELGTSEPNIQKLLKISAILDVSLDELLCRPDYLKSLEESFDDI